MLKVAIRNFAWTTSKLVENPAMRDTNAACRYLDKILAQKRIKPLPTTIALSELHFAPGSIKCGERLGRSRRAGRFCGRGNGGTKSYAENHFSRLFAGGNVPFHRTVPKFGFKDISKKSYTIVNLDRIQLLIDTQRIDPTQLITPKVLHECGIRMKDGIHIGDDGASALQTPCKIVANRFTQQAIDQIVRTGGIPVAMHFTALSLRTVLEPHRIVGTTEKPTGKRLPRMAAPVKERDKLYYFSKRNRGYLHPDMQQIIQNDAQLKEFFSRAVIIPPRPGILEKIELIEQEKSEETYGFNF